MTQFGITEICSYTAYINTVMSLQVIPKNHSELNQLVLLLLEQLRVHSLSVRETVPGTGKCLWTRDALERPLPCMLVDVELEVLSPLELLLAVRAHFRWIVLLLFRTQFGSERN